MTHVLLFCTICLKLALFCKSDAALTSLNFSFLRVQSAKRIAASAWQGGDRAVIEKEIPNELPSLEKF